MSDIAITIGLIGMIFVLFGLPMICKVWAINSILKNLSCKKCGHEKLNNKDLKELTSALSEE